MPAAALSVPSGLTFGWNGTKLLVMPKREQPGLIVPICIVRLCVGYADWPSEATCAQIFGVPAGLPWTLPVGHRYGES